MSVNDIDLARQALAHWPCSLESARIEHFGNGLINTTFRVTADDGRRYILQAMNAVFAPEINFDIDALSRHLRSQGMPAPELIRPNAPSGHLWIASNGRNWRLSTFIPGVCHDRLETPAQAWAAGELLGRFHQHVSGLKLPLRTPRLGVHDTRRHLAALRETMAQHQTHRYRAEIMPLAEAILDVAGSLEPLPPLPDCLVHGDPKISNLLFDESDGQGICMIDLDTLAYMPLPLELGDAFRSWCNPKGEDVPAAGFRQDFFAAAVLGYASVRRGELTTAEWQSFLPATLTITIELASRFARDAFEEVYFGWNPDSFADRSTHCRVRAAGQLALFHSLQSQYSQAMQALDAAFARSDQ